MGLWVLNHASPAPSHGAFHTTKSAIGCSEMPALDHLQIGGFTIKSEKAAFLTENLSVPFNVEMPLRSKIGKNPKIFFSGPGISIYWIIGNQTKISTKNAAGASPRSSEDRGLLLMSILKIL